MRFYLILLLLIIGLFMLPAKAFAWCSLYYEVYEPPGSYGGAYCYTCATYNGGQLMDTEECFADGGKTYKYYQGTDCSCSGGGGGNDPPRPACFFNDRIDTYSVPSSGSFIQNSDGTLYSDTGPCKVTITHDIYDPNKSYGQSQFRTKSVDSGNPVRWRSLGVNRYDGTCIPPSNPPNSTDPADYDRDHYRFTNNWSASSGNNLSITTNVDQPDDPDIVAGSTLSSTGCTMQAMNGEPDTCADDNCPGYPPGTKRYCTAYAYTRNAINQWSNPTTTKLYYCGDGVCANDSTGHIGCRENATNCPADCAAVPTPPPAATCTIQGLKYLIPGGPSVPATGQIITLDGSATATTSPYFFTNIPAGNHTVTASSLGGYQTSFSACPNCIDHPTFTNGNSTLVNCPAGGYLDLYWKNTQIVAPPAPTIAKTCVNPTGSNLPIPFTVSWTNGAVPVDVVNISTYADYMTNTSRPFYNKFVYDSAASVTGPVGFYRWDRTLGRQVLTDPLILQPNIPYYFYLWNGAASPLVTLPSIPSCTPNCGSLTGTGTIVLGNTGTYNASYSSPLGNLSYAISVGQYSPSVGIYKYMGGSTIQAVTPTSAPSANISGMTWTPTATGNYDLFCRAWNDGIAECRGNSNYISGPLQYSCLDQLSSTITGVKTMTVAVVPPDLSPPIVTTPTPPPPQIPGTMNQFCRVGSYTGNEFTIDWTNPVGYPVTSVDISTYADINTNASSPFYYKVVYPPISTSTTAPSGFCQYPYTPPCDSSKNPLVLLPNVQYYARVYNGVATNGGHSAVVPFIVNCPINGGWSGWTPPCPACGGGTQTRTCTSPAPAYGGASCVGSSSQICPAITCPAFMKTVGGDVHANQ